MLFKMRFVPCHNRRHITIGKPVMAQQYQERLCDTAFEDCRQPLWTLIGQETVQIDVAFWFMFDTSLSNALIAAKNRNVNVRVLIDTDALQNYPGTQVILNDLAAAGIPMRNYSGADASGIQHWKMMLFAGQIIAQESQPIASARHQPRNTTSKTVPAAHCKAGAGKTTV